MAPVVDALRQALGLDTFLSSIPRSEASFATPPTPSPRPTQPGVAGLLTPGNIDLNHRPVVRNPDGSYSTVRSISFDMDGHEVLVPTVSPDGRVLSDRDALALYQRTGQHLGIFDTPEHADAYAESLHNQQAQQYAPPPPGFQFPASPVAQPVSYPPPQAAAAVGAVTHALRGIF